MNKNIDYKSELNPRQLDAVQSTEGPHLVIAGAGSGKTRTLTYRVAYLVEKGVAPDNILLLTFTRKAAQEMLRRAILLLDNRCSRVSGGTFHSFANMVLRKYAHILGISPGFTILDETDSEDTLNLVRTQLGFNRTEKRFPRKSALRDVISKSINKSADIGAILEGEYPHFIEWEAEIKKINQQYHKYKQEHMLLDYDDLLVYLRDLLVNHEDVRRRLACHYRYIMVDEYQDTNKIQAHIVCLLASEHKNIMVVGDDSQSIYSFRGANFKNIIDFPNIFKGARVILLEENYRSTQPILNLANCVISNAREKFEKNLFTRKKSACVPFFIDARDEHAQSRYIADKILELREEGMELKDMAVLFRSAWHSNDLEVELASRDIPFVKYGGHKFAEAAHIKDIIAYLRIIWNISDEVSWYRVLLLMRKVGPKTAEKLIQGLINKKSVFDIEDAGIKNIEDFNGLLKVLKKIDPQNVTPSQLLHAFGKYYQPIMTEKYDDYPKRMNDLDSLERIAERYQTLEAFLSDMAIEPPERALIAAGQKDKSDSPLTLSTIHSAKGLEWKTVFLIYVAEGHLPSYLSLENDDDIEEERRLFYVAVTRAKDNLFLLKPHLDRSPRGYGDQGGAIFTQPSRFVEEGGAIKYLAEVQLASMDEDSEMRFGRRRFRDDFLEKVEDYFN